MGSFLSIVNDTADTFQCKVGADEAALAIFGIIAGVIGAVALIVAGAGTYVQEKKNAETVMYRHGTRTEHS